MSNLNRVKLDDKQLTAWDDTRSALLYFAPALTHVFYKLMNKDDDYIVVATDSEEVPTAATDGSCVVVNVNRYFDHPLMERLFILAHEILHNILNHIPLMYYLRRQGYVQLANGKRIPFVESIFQWAMDLVINAILVDSKIGQIPPTALIDMGFAGALDSVIDIYVKLYTRMTSGGAKGPPDGKEGFDAHLDPGTGEDKLPQEALEEINEVERATVIKAAMEAAQSQGRLPKCMEHLFKEIVTTKVNWTDHIQSFFNRRVGSGGVNWRKPDRRLIVRDIWVPSRSGYGADLVVVAGDTSGSIWTQPRVLDMWFAAISEILDQLNPKKIVAIWCDENIGRIDEVEDATDLKEMWKKVLPGGGSTSFVPVFSYVEEHRMEPDALVYLTDGWGTFPRMAPRYPTVWGALANTLDPKQYPFGDVVVLPAVN